MTLGGEKAEEHPDTGCAQLRRSPSRLSGSFQDKLTQVLSIEPLRIVSNVLEQSSNPKAVVVQCAIRGPTLLPHPLKECGKQDWFYCYCLRGH
jgi:hypothetical protein